MIDSIGKALQGMTGGKKSEISMMTASIGKSAL
jgi:hypothetical protein